MKYLKTGIMSLTIIGAAANTQAASFYWQRDCQGAPTATVSFTHQSQFENSYACLQADSNVQSQPQIQKYILSYMLNGACTNSGGIPEFVSLCRSIAPGQPESASNAQGQAPQRTRPEHRSPHAESYERVQPARQRTPPVSQVDTFLTDPVFDSADLAAIRSGQAAISLLKVHRDLRCNLSKETATLFKNWNQTHERSTRYSEDIPDWTALVNLVARIASTGFTTENTPERPRYGYGANFPGGKSHGVSLRNSGNSSSASPEAQSLVDFIELNCNF